MAIVKSAAIRLAKATGRYRDVARSRQAKKVVDSLRIKTAPSGFTNITVEEYAVARGPKSVRNVIVTPNGLGIRNGCIDRSLSVHPPSFLEMAFAGRRCTAEVAQATLLQAQTPNTYGDWVAQCLMSLTRHHPIRYPLAVPRTLFAKSYVKRDLALLEIAHFEVKSNILVREAMVLPQSRPVSSFSCVDIEHYRNAFGISPPEPEPGSLIYLSRVGETAEAVGREYPNREIAEIVTALGGTVIEAQTASLEKYKECATKAETVIADHGSAMCNLLLWRTKSVIELYTTDWWNKYFVCLAYACGIPNYTLIGIDKFNETTREQVICAVSTARGQISGLSRS